MVRLEGVISADGLPKGEWGAAWPIPPGVIGVIPKLAIVGVAPEEFWRLGVPGTEVLGVPGLGLRKGMLAMLSPGEEHWTAYWE